MNKSSCLFFFMLAVLLAQADIIGPKDNFISLRNISIADGMSGNQIEIIYPDSAGYIWIGSEVGVDRFDGNHLVSYPLPASFGEDDCRIFDLLELPGGRLFAGSSKGVLELDKKSNIIKELHLSIPIGSVRDLNKGESLNIIWAAAKDGLYRIDLSSLQAKKILIEKNALSSANDIRGVHYDRTRNGIWIASKSNISFYDIRLGKIQTYKSGIKDKFQSITSYGDMLYMATRNNGVCRFDKRTRTFLPPLNFGNNIIMSVKAKSDGRLVVGVDCDGVYIYSIGEQRVLNHYDTTNSNMPTNSVYCTIIDKRGILWIGYYQAGFGYTPVVPELLELYTTPAFPDLKNKEVRAFGIEPGYKLIGTRRGLYFIDENLGKGKLFTRPEIQSDVIFSIHKWNGLYYIGTYRGGVYTFNPITHTLSPLTENSGINKTASCWDIVEDEKGNLWFATSSGVYVVDSSGNWKHYSSRNSQLPPGNVYYIFFDTTGRGWIATHTGIALWDGKEIRSNCFPAEFKADRRYYSIYEDKNHILYFIPSRGDLFKSNLELTEFSDFNLDTDKRIVVNFMTESGSGRLLLGTNFGLGYIEKGKFKLINNKGSISNSIFMTGRPVRFGNITWMGNGLGLVKLNNNKEKNINHKAHRPLSFTTIYSDGKDVFPLYKNSNDNHSGSITINVNELEIGVSDLSYVDPENEEIEYILEGIQKKWKSIPANETIHLENLKGGANRLLVRRPGEPDSEIALEINVKTNGISAYLISIVIIFTILGIVLFIYIRRNKQHKLIDEKEPDQEKKRYISSRISENDCSTLYDAIEQVMREKKPYLNSEFKIQDLANMVGSSSFALSYLFNQYMKIGYLNYINGYRVEEFKKIVAEEGTSKYTLTGIALKCGFSSRASFFRHFKSSTGLTPSQYIKETHLR